MQRCYVQRVHAVTRKKTVGNLFIKACMKLTPMEDSFINNIGRTAYSIDFTRITKGIMWISLRLLTVCIEDFSPLHVNAPRQRPNLRNLILLLTRGLIHETWAEQLPYQSYVNCHIEFNSTIYVRMGFKKNLHKLAMHCGMATVSNILRVI